MKSVLITIFNLATIIKGLSETSQLVREHKNFINTIHYKGFFSKFKLSMMVSGFSQTLMLIYCCSFLEEYDKEFQHKKHPSYKKQIIEFKTAVKPAIKRIKKWKGLRHYRNNILTHNLRVKGNSIFDFEEPVQYNVPSTNEEYFLLAELVFLVSTSIHLYFPNLTSEINLDQRIIDFAEIESEKIDCINEYERIKTEINDLINKRQ